ncbi:MAG: hypothetical protein IAE89_09695 [Anaerolineae bacterium]|nr:hypothetical protein [Anaerolineae bacterium]
MAELIERYVHQVGRYLSSDERAEIEAELRSQIQDQLEDRYPDAPTPSEIAAVLSELGDPRKMAVSYGSQQYLVGPELYPFLIMVLRRGLFIIPTIAIFIAIFQIISAPPADQGWLSLIFGIAFGAAQAALIFGAVVVGIFALIQHFGVAVEAFGKPFNPLELPEVGDPAAVDRLEIWFGTVIGVPFMLAVLHFLRVGGLTLSFNPADPANIIPVPALWLVILLINTLVIIILNLLVLRRGRWGVKAWILETLLELFGMIALYFVLYVPLLQRLLAAVPALNDIPLITAAPEMIVVVGAAITLAARGNTLASIIAYQQGRRSQKS